jgi:hypothetical protein
MRHLLFQDRNEAIVVVPFDQMDQLIGNDILKAGRQAGLVFRTMAIDVFVSPVYKTATVPVARAMSARPLEPWATPSPGDAWRELALAGDWEGALLAHLRWHGDQQLLLWRVINEIATSTMPERRWVLRETKKRLLEALFDLIRAKKVRRWRRSYIRIVDAR